MGMIVSVYRNGSNNCDCTNGGMTNNKTGVSKLCIINADGPFEPTNDAPAAMIEATVKHGSVRIVATAPRWVGHGTRMFGGSTSPTPATAVQRRRQRDHRRRLRWPGRHPRPLRQRSGTVPTGRG